LIAPSRSTIALFELEPWEEAYLRERLAGVEIRTTLETLDEQTIDLAQGASLISVFIRSRISDPLLTRLPAVRYIATRSTGYDHIDLASCQARGIVVSNVPTYGENTVAEHTFGLMLSLSRKIHQAYSRTIRGDFSLGGLRGFDLKGRTLGVVGAGHIGLHVVRIGRGFGMDVLAYDLVQQPLLAEVLGFRYASLDELLAQSDVVTLHLPYLPATHHLLDRRRLGTMKRGALLINTARGAIVDTAALLWALDEGIIAGAGLDVVEGEDLIAEEQLLLREGVATDQLQAAVRGHVLLRRENVVITPHIAFDSQEALQRILDTTVDNVRAFVAGEPRNTVRGPAPTPHLAG
jgi:D-lactate dehydrogenase